MVSPSPYLITSSSTCEPRGAGGSTVTEPRRLRSIISLASLQMWGCTSPPVPRCKWLIAMAYIVSRLTEVRGGSGHLPVSTLHKLLILQSGPTFMLVMVQTCEYRCWPRAIFSPGSARTSERPNHCV